MDSIFAKQRGHSGIVTMLSPRAVPYQGVVRFFEQRVEGGMRRNKKEEKYDKGQYSEVSTVWPTVSRFIVLCIYNHVITLVPICLAHRASSKHKIVKL